MSRIHLNETVTPKPPDPFRPGATVKIGDRTATLIERDGTCIVPSCNEDVWRIELDTGTVDAQCATDLEPYPD